MKKRITNVLLATLALTMFFCGCNTEKIKITFVNGTKKIGESIISAGSKVKNYSDFENLEGYEFLGWYETPTLLEASKKDLKTAKFSENKILYGNFKSLNVAEDTRKWFVVGAGSSTILASSKWAGKVEDSIKDKCELKPTGKEKNEFSITLDLFKGDQFQVISDWQWDGQKGYGCFTSINEDEMENGGSLSGSDTKSNVNVKQDGNYTIILTTDPDNSLQDTLTIKRNRDPIDPKAAQVQEEKPKFTPSNTTSVVVKGSWVSDWSENLDLSRIPNTNKFSIPMELKAGTELYFMIFDKGEDTGLGLNASSVKDDVSKSLIEEAYNVKVKTDGKYTFVVDTVSMTISISK